MPIDQLRNARPLRTMGAGQRFCSNVSVPYAMRYTFLLDRIYARAEYEPDFRVTLHAVGELLKHAIEGPPPDPELNRLCARIANVPVRKRRGVALLLALCAATSCGPGREAERKTAAEIVARSRPKAVDRSLTAPGMHGAGASALLRQAGGRDPGSLRRLSSAATVASRWRSATPARVLASSS